MKSLTEICLTFLAANTRLINMTIIPSDLQERLTQKIKFIDYIMSGTHDAERTKPYLVSTIKSLTSLFRRYGDYKIYGDLTISGIMDDDRYSMFMNYSVFTNIDYILFKCMGASRHWLYDSDTNLPAILLVKKHYLQYAAGVFKDDVNKLIIIEFKTLHPILADGIESNNCVMVNIPYIYMHSILNT